MLYDKFAARYDRVTAPLERRFLRELRSKAASFLPRRGYLLEIGAGTGANFKFYPVQASVAAAELSLEMLKFARLTTHSNKIKLIQADAQMLPFPDDSFDAAIAALVFCSLKLPENGFRELVRTVKPGGRIVLLEHVRPAGLPGYVFDFLNLFSTRFFDDCINRETAKTAEDCGLSVISIEKAAFGIINLIVCENKKSI